MSVDRLIASLLDACERKTLADHFRDGGMNTAGRKTCGERLREVVEVQESLRTRGLAEPAAALMDGDISPARMSAALICLGLDEPKALATLESIEKASGSPESGDARLLLAQ